MTEVAKQRGQVERRRVLEAVVPTDTRLVIDEFAAAKVLGKSVFWMRRARWAGNGPAYLKLGGSIRYRLQDLNDFMERRMRCSTSDDGQLDR